jgi:hypothetical protein
VRPEGDAGFELLDIFLSKVRTLLRVFGDLMVEVILLRSNCFTIIYFKLEGCRPLLK